MQKAEQRKRIKTPERIGQHWSTRIQHCIVSKQLIRKHIHFKNSLNVL